MAAALAVFSHTFSLPTVPTALSRSQQSFRSANHQPWEHHDRLQPSADLPHFIGIYWNGFVIGAVVAMGSAVRHRKRKQKTSTLRFAAKVVAAAPLVANKNAEATTDKTRIAKPSSSGRGSRKLRPVLSDPDAPKRPMNSFFRYLLEYRKGTEAKGTVTEMTVAAAAKWNTKSPDDRAQWQQAYDTDRKKYVEDRQKYVNSGKRDAWYRDPEKPKRALNPYMQFWIEQRENYSQLSVTEQTKKIGQKWTALASSKKEKYEKAYVQGKQAFELAWTSYKASGKEDEWLTKVGITAAREKFEAKRNRKKEVAATIKEKAAQARAKAKAQMANVVLKQLRQKQQAKKKLLLDKLKAVRATKIAAERKANGLQNARLVAAKLKLKAATAEATRKKKATSAQIKEGLKKKIVTAKLKAGAVKAKAKPKTLAVKV